MPEPSFGAPQVTVLLVFAGIALGLIGLFTVVALTTRREVPFDEVRATGYRIRRWWLAGLSALLLAGVVISLFHLPYTQARGRVVTVRVSGGQFYWSTSPRTVPAGSRVRFAVTSVDVNHAMGVYSPKGVLLGVVQAMPGYTNKLELQLDEPGNYLISCLEFCGLRHHRMYRTFQVNGGRA